MYFIYFSYDLNSKHFPKEIVKWIIALLREVGVSLLGLLGAYLLFDIVFVKINRAEKEILDKRNNSKKELIDFSTKYGKLNLKDKNYNKIRQAEFNEICFRYDNDFTDLYFPKHINLSYLNLSNIDFSRSRFPYANFSNCKISGDTNFSEMMAPGADFSESEIINTNFSNSRLRSGNFTNAILTNLSFKEAFLARANFSGTHLKGGNYQNISVYDEDSVDKSIQLNGGVIFSKETKFEKSEGDIKHYSCNGDTPKFYDIVLSWK